MLACKDLTSKSFLWFMIQMLVRCNRHAENSEVVLLQAGTLVHVVMLCVAVVTQVHHKLPESQLQFLKRVLSFQA